MWCSSRGFKGEGFFRGGQKALKPKGFLLLESFNTGTGGGGGGPGGKSFPKCARRAWVGWHGLVYFVLVERRWGGRG